MNGALLLSFVALLATDRVEAQERWKTVDEGFLITIPRDWKKEKVHPIDSNCGTYKAKNADLEFDEVFGLGYTTNEANAAVASLKKKESNPKLLKPGEEVWHIDGRIADFSSGMADQAIYGRRRFSNVARLHVPYEHEQGYLSIFILYRSNGDLPVARRVLQSIKWKKRAGSPQPNERCALGARTRPGLHVGCRRPGASESERYLAGLAAHGSFAIPPQF